MILTERIFKLTGIYIHVPFCKRKCPYCDFYSVTYDEGMAEAYVCAVKRNLDRYRDSAVFVDTVYFGGGTPSLLSPEQIGDILSSVRKNFIVAPETEITMEANPSSVDFEKLCDYRSVGVNRISFGVQSACDSELSALGRLHDYEQAENAVMAAQRAGFFNISCDLMIGTPRQTAESLLESAKKIASLPVTHISAYMLKIEEGTMFDCDWVRQNIADEEQTCDMYERLIGTLEGLGFYQYEISNFSRKGCESRHNLKYWRGQDYLGFGPAAHSYFEGKRFFVPKDVYEYVSGDYQEEIIEEENPDKAEEYVLLSLRLKEGISFERYAELGGDASRIMKKAAVFDGSGLIRLSETGISLTPKGFLVSNGIIAELLY